MKDLETLARHDSSAFYVLLLSLVGVGALGLRNELGIALWVTFLCTGVLRLRSERVEPLPRALVVPSTLRRTTPTNLD